MKCFIKCAAGLLVSVGLVLLAGCQLKGDQAMKQKTAETAMLEYLESRYSDAFSILLAEEKIAGPSPILSFRSNPTYWTFTVVSSRFPDDTFTVTRTVNGNWKDNYYSLLLYDQVVDLYDKIISEKLTTDYMIRIVWDTQNWPEGTGEEISLEEWIKAGGRIPSVHIYLRNTEPDASLCKVVVRGIQQAIPATDSVVFFGITDEAFSFVRQQTISTVDVLNGHYDEWVLGRLAYPDWNTKGDWIIEEEKP